MNDMINFNPTAQFLPRPRLDEMFHQAFRRKLVCVIAGAGYGKTQAVRHYVQQQQDAVVRWVQLTEGDNIASRFWEHLTHAVSLDNPELAVKLREFGFPRTSAHFKQLAEIIKSAEHRSCSIFFVMDDFHLIHSKEAFAFAERCFHLQIPGVCMVILSRKEPEVNIVSLLSKGRACMITEDDLRFTAEEATAFFRQCAIVLSAQDIARLMETTKGWALAINMLSVVWKRMPGQFGRALEITMQNIFKFLETEAWDDFPAHVQTTMVKISLLSALSRMPLQEIIGDIDFLQATPGLASFVWFDTLINDFRIHPLYLEFLQSKHHMLSDEEKLETYRRAAQWCAENNFYIDAIYYHAKSRQYERMIQMFFSYPMKLPRDASEYFLSILEQLEEVPDNYNVLLLKNYFIPLLMVGAGRYEEARKRCFAVIRAWEEVDSPLSILLLHAIYSLLAYLDMYTCTLTHEYNAPVYLKKSVEYLKRSTIAPTEKAAAFLNADVRSFACLVGDGASLPELDQFLEATRQTALLIEETTYSVYVGYDDLVACEYAFFKNQPELARKHAHSAIWKAREKKQYSTAVLAEKYLLRIATQEGNAPLVKEILKQLRAYLDDPDFWNRQLYYDLYTGAFYAQIGFPEMVPSWLITDEKESASEIRFPARELYVSVLYYIASKKYTQALAVLCNSYPREPQERFLFGELRFLLLAAVAKCKTGDVTQAMVDFEKAYHMSFQGMFELFFIELGKELHPLMAAALKQTNCGIPQEWLKAIDRKASIYAKKIAVITNAFQHEMNREESISLSTREQEVLTDLYHGLSREEIAANRYLSINTVKKVLQSIYIKLDAHNSVDAVRIALEQKLLE